MVFESPWPKWPRKYSVRANPELGKNPLLQAENFAHCPSWRFSLSRYRKFRDGERNPHPLRAQSLKCPANLAEVQKYSGNLTEDSLITTVPNMCWSLQGAQVWEFRPLLFFTSLNPIWEVDSGTGRKIHNYEDCGCFSQFCIFSARWVCAKYQRCRVFLLCLHM